MSVKLLVSELEGRAKQLSKSLYKILEVAKEVEIKEVFTAVTAPAWVKDLPKEAKDGWIKAFNAAFKTYKGDESKSFATAASIAKIGSRFKMLDIIAKSNCTLLGAALIPYSISPTLIEQNNNLDSSGKLSI